MRNITLLICLLLIIIFAPSLKERCTDLYCSLQRIEHSVTYSNKGTRSEAKHGHLFINGKELADVFILVKSGDTAYKFYQRKNMWGMDGYFPYAEKEKSAVKASSKQIGKEDLARGWYTGAELLKDTPADWIFTEWKAGSAYVSPEAILDMIQTLKLKTLPRWTGPKILMKQQ